jgi:TP901 family phage tail tape measure protein
MPLTATLALNIANFEAGLQKAGSSLTTFEKATKNTSRDLTRVMEGFSGEKVIVEASRMAEAVKRVGGASALTEKEQGRVNAVVTEAIAKYDKLGQTAPEHLRTLQRETQAVERDTRTMGERLTDVGGHLTSLGTIATAAITVPIVGGLGLAATAAINFESSFAGVRKTVDATEPEFAALSQGLRDMAKELPTSVHELNAVAEAAGQLGIKKEDILEFTRTMADLGVTTNLTADQAATATAQIQNIFGAAGKDVQQFGATLVALGNAGASTEKDIIEMSLRIAGAGNQVGLTQAQVLSFSSALSSVGINAEAGGSSMSRVFLKINDAVADGGEKMAEFARIAGMSSEQFSRAFRDDAASATVAFISGLNRIKAGGENVNATLEELVGKNIIIKDTLLRASGAGNLLAEQLTLGNAAWKQNTALTAEAEQRYGTVESQLKILKNQFMDVAITIGTSLLPVMRDLLSAIKPAIDAAAFMAEKFAALPEPVRTVTLAVMALAAAVGPVVVVLGTLTSAAGTLLTAYAGVTAASAGVAAGVGGVGVASGVAATGVAGLGAAFMAAAPPMAAFLVASTSVVAVGAAIRNAIGLYTDRLGQSSLAIEQNKSHQLALAAASQLTGRAITDVAEANRILAADAAILRAEHQAGTSVATAAVTAHDALGAALKRTTTATEKAGKAKKDYSIITGELSNVLRMQLAGVLVPSLIEFETHTDNAAEAMQDLIDNLHRASGAATTVAPVLASSMKLPFAQLPSAVTASGTATDGFFSNFKAALGDAGMNAQSLSGLFAQAFTGGGGALGAMKAFATQGMSALLGMVPGVGPFLQQFAGPIIAGFGKIAAKVKSMFKGLFGGPDRDEMAGREVVHAFEGNLATMLTAQQKAEAGGESWKMTVIAIRDAYIAQGRSADEAMQDAERLWKSSKQGGAESERVVAEIEQKMNEYAAATRDATAATDDITTALDAVQFDEQTLADAAALKDQTKLVEGVAKDAILAFDGISKAISRIPRDVDVDVNARYTPPAGPDPGYATGTMGRHGSFFQNFGDGTPTVLHGTEAVVTPRQAPAFARSVLGAGGGGRTDPALLAAIRDLPRSIKMALREGLVMA